MIPSPNQKAIAKEHDSKKTLMKTYYKQKRWTSKKYLDFVRQQLCIICGRSPVEAHHVKTIGSGGDDTFAVPLCIEHHCIIHTIGIKSFQKKYDVNIYEQLFMIAKSWIEKNAA